MTCERHLNTRRLFNQRIEAFTVLVPGKLGPRSPTDQQCSHCGLYFDVRGIESHEENCSIPESEFEYQGDRIVLKQCEECGVWGVAHLGGCSKSGVPDEILKKHPELANVMVV